MVLRHAGHHVRLLLSPGDATMLPPLWGTAVASLDISARPGSHMERTSASSLVLSISGDNSDGSRTVKHAPLTDNDLQHTILIQKDCLAQRSFLPRYLLGTLLHGTPFRKAAYKSVLRSDSSSFQREKCWGPPEHPARVPRLISSCLGRCRRAPSGSLITEELTSFLLRGGRRIAACLPLGGTPSPQCFCIACQSCSREGRPEWPRGGSARSPTTGALAGCSPISLIKVPA